MTAAHRERILIGMGSNVGDRRAHLRAAVRRIGEIPGLEVDKCTADCGMYLDKGELEKVRLID